MDPSLIYIYAYYVLLYSNLMNYKMAVLFIFPIGKGVAQRRATSLDLNPMPSLLEGILVREKKSAHACYCYIIY